jgi:hypothetical protein
MQEEIKEVLKESTVTKGDIPAAVGIATTGTIWGATANEWAAISTVVIMATVVIQKVFSMWLEYHRYKMEVKNVQTKSKKS